jgi:NodT family efflux transporter outer membrane factor (OMF) lipoprotein
MRVFPLKTSIFIVAPLFIAAGCVIGPRYQRPSVATPAAYKELTAADYKNTEGWKVAQPRDATIRGNWWTIFNDPQLNALEDKVNVSNQSIASAAASFFAARALVKEARSELFPTVSVNASIIYSRTASTGPLTTYDLPFDATWTPDLWGSIQNTIKAAAYNAQSTAATLQNTRLTIQTEVAEDYFSLRGQDALKSLLDATVVADQQTLDLTKWLFQEGIDQQQSIAEAESQLQATQAADINLGIERAEYEHAIAMLTGQPASTFSLPVQALQPNPPAIPLGVPSQLLERRPDIAASERLVAQANAQIGIAEAAYFPTVTLSASAGFESNSLQNWFSWPNRFFSVGPSATETIFDAGLRDATVTQYKAQYDETVANYRQTVLAAFQQVEDDLASLRILSAEVQHQDAAVTSAAQALAEEINRYKLGLDPYIDVLTLQTTLLSDQQTAVTLRIQQMTISGALIEALGGGWDASQLPSADQLIADP